MPRLSGSLAAPRLTMPNGRTPNRTPVNPHRRQPPRAPGRTSPEPLLGAHARVAVGSGVSVSGKLIFDEPVRIEGRFRGEVRSTDLVVVGDQGIIDGRVDAPRLLVMGEIRGEVRSARLVVLEAGARVYGSIEAEKLRVAAGAHLDCQVHMTSGAASAPANQNPPRLRKPT